MNIYDICYIHYEAIEKENLPKEINKRTADRFKRFEIKLHDIFRISYPHTVHRAIDFLIYAKVKEEKLYKLIAYQLACSKHHKSRNAFAHLMCIASEDELLMKIGKKDLPLFSRYKKYGYNDLRKVLKDAMKYYAENYMHDFIGFLTADYSEILLEEYAHIGLEAMREKMYEHLKVKHIKKIFHLYKKYKVDIDYNKALQCIMRSHSHKRIESVLDKYGQYLNDDFKSKLEDNYEALLSEAILKDLAK